MLVRAVLTDFDGPVNDSYHEGLRRIQMLCALETIPFTVVDRQRLKQNWGKPGRMLLLDSVEAITTEEMADRIYRQWIVYDQENPIPLVPDARSTLAWLRKHNGFPTGCITSRDPEDIEKLFTIIDIDQYFDAVSTKQIVNGEVICKPDPRVIQPIFDRFQEIADDSANPDELRRRYDGITPGDCIFIGDTRSDVLAGWQYGMGATLVVLNGPINAEQIEQLHEDPEIAEQYDGRKLQFSEILRDISGVVDWLERFHEGELAPYRRVT